MNDVSKYIQNNRLSVIVKPNSRKTELLGFNDEKNAFKIAISEPAENNKANKELIRFISKLLKRKVLIEKGEKSMEKILRIY
jgi:uncharacterized protein